ncbi:hypothetical protein TNCV_3251371 [Trichonephila clavipes]|nr:hypothetical protein TNCV_3251371 [Trichonephila clavipes]
MAAVDFLHHKNISTWAGVEPTTLGAESQRQTIHATQPANNWNLVTNSRFHFPDLETKIVSYNPKAKTFLDRDSHFGLNVCALQMVGRQEALLEE